MQRKEDKEQDNQLKDEMTAFGEGNTGKGWGGRLSLLFQCKTLTTDPATGQRNADVFPPYSFKRSWAKISEKTVFKAYKN